jgi:hypothetical protein
MRGLPIRCHASESSYICFVKFINNRLCAPNLRALFGGVFSDLVEHQGFYVAVCVRQELDLRI